jgi:urocanate hydratase
MRHADAGYEDALACARENGLDLPMTGDQDAVPRAR